MKKLIGGALICAYVAGVTITTVGSATDFCGNFKSIRHKRYFYREHVGFFMVVSLIPVLPWVTYAFITGGYPYGFAWSQEECEAVKAASAFAESTHAHIAGPRHGTLRRDYLTNKENRWQKYWKCCQK